MKKLLTFILAIYLFLLPTLAFGAAAAITASERLSMGNWASVTGIITASSADTVATGLSSIIFFSMTAESAGANPGVATSAYSYSISGGTVTVYPVTNAIRWRFLAIGGP